MTGIALSSLGNNSSSGGGLLSGGSLSPTSGTLAGLQGGASILGMMSSIQTGNEQATALRQQAADAQLNSSQAVVSGQNQVTGLKQQLLSTIGSRTAAAGASGVDVGQGVTASGNATIAQRADNTAQIDIDNAGIQSRRQQINALADEQQANADQSAGLTRGLGSLLGGMFSLGRAVL